MRVATRLDERLVDVLVAKGWRRVGGHRFVGSTHVIHLLPNRTEDRVTLFYGRRASAGAIDRLADCSRITLADTTDLSRFLTRL